MRKILVSALFATSIVAAGSAIAADVPDRRPTRPAPAYTPAQVVSDTWTGLSVSVDGGWGWASVKNDPSIPGMASVDPEGWIAGLSVTASKQWGMLVGGVNLSVYMTDLKHTTDNSGPGFTSVQTAKIKYLAVADARVGVAMGNLLVSVGGGIGAAELQATDRFRFDDPIFGTFASEFRQTNYAVGPAAVASAQYKVGSWFAGVDLKYADLRVFKVSSTSTDPFFGTTSFSSSTRIPVTIAMGRVGFTF